MVEQLTEKCRQLQAKLKDCEQEHKQLQTEHTGVLAEMETLRFLLSIRLTFKFGLLVKQKKVFENILGDVD